MRVTSSNAYMLLYRAVPWQEAHSAPAREGLPAELVAELADVEEAHKQGLEGFAARKEERVQQTEARKKVRRGAQAL